MTQLFDEMASEVATLKSLLQMIPAENVIDRASLEARISVVVEKAIKNAAVRVTQSVTTPPSGFSDANRIVKL